MTKILDLGNPKDSQINTGEVPTISGPGNPKDEQIEQNYDNDLFWEFHGLFDKIKIRSN